MDSSLCGNDRRGGNDNFNKLTQFGIALCIVVALYSGCAAVKPFEREKLADPLIEPTSQMAKQSLDQKFFTSREGSIGGADGIGGGCGCAK
jgi:hypothetical protein